MVTGGSSGIGAAIVKTLADAGTNVILHYGHKQQAATAIAEKIGQDKCYLLQANLAEKNAAVKL
ncbi:MAG: SDR family NAD(P)-dependent oxidoreductase [Microcoleaceae cyanobacterium MO_207.B10]|nr:SDR family NAD(P)-dependent oxidoreductase [Microcoleaceae cyanobacterium MO_207.B10]